MLVPRVRRAGPTAHGNGAGWRFCIGFADGLTAAEAVPHTVIHIVPRRAANHVTLPECNEWISDDGVLGRVRAEEHHPVVEESVNRGCRRIPRRT